MMHAVLNVFWNLIVIMWMKKLFKIYYVILKQILLCSIKTKLQDFQDENLSQAFIFCRVYLVLSNNIKVLYNRGPILILKDLN